MAIQDRNCDRAAAFVKKELVVPVVTATSLSGVKVFSFTPAYPYEVLRVRHYARTVTGTVTAAVKVGGTLVSSSGTGFTAATESAVTLSTTLADLRGGASDAITVELTTDGTGALTNGCVIVEYRPTGLVGETTLPQ